MTSTLTPEQHQAIIDRLTSHPILAKGVGTEDEACSIASINLALTGRLTDVIPACMSEVIGRWIITIQDAMPADIRNSLEWRELLSHAAGTGCDLERERAAILLDHMWEVTLPIVQPVADAYGFGAEWLAMCQKRTTTAAAKAAHYAHYIHYAATARYAADAVAVYYAANVAAAATAAAAHVDAWQTINPVGLLRQLIAVTA